VPFVALLIFVGLGLIAFALRPGPWMFDVTEESLRPPPGGRGSSMPREWLTEADLERQPPRRMRPWGDASKDAIDWARSSVAARRRRSSVPSLAVTPPSELRAVR
jgi:hypothetical protein